MIKTYKHKGFEFSKTNITTNKTYKPSNSSYYKTKLRGICFRTSK